MHNIENYPDFGQFYPPQLPASADNITFNLDNSLYHAQTHPMIIYYQVNFVFIRPLPH